MRAIRYPIGIHTFSKIITEGCVVLTAFRSSLVDHFLRGTDGESAFNLKKCLHDINDGRPEDFMLSMKSLFADTSSEYEKDKEIHFQMKMATLFFSKRMEGLYSSPEPILLRKHEPLPIG